MFLIFIAPSLGTGQSPESPSLPPFCLQTPVQPHLDIPYRNPLLLPHCSLCSMPFPSVPDLQPPFSLSLLLPCIQARIQKFHNPILWFTKQFLRPLLDTEEGTKEKLGYLSKLLSFLTTANRTWRSGWNSLPSQSFLYSLACVLSSFSESLLFLFYKTHMWHLPYLPSIMS